MNIILFHDIVKPSERGVSPHIAQSAFKVRFSGKSSQLQLLKKNSGRGRESVHRVFPKIMNVTAFCIHSFSAFFTDKGRKGWKKKVRRNWQTAVWCYANVAIREAITGTSIPDETCFAQKMKYVRAEKYNRLAKEFKEVSFKAELTNKAESQEGECTMRNWFGEAWEKGRAEGLEQGITALITICREFGATFEETAEKLKDKFDLSDAEIQKDMAQYW